MIRKPSKKFMFAVEGDTEAYYLKWLSAQINNCPSATYKCAEVNPIITKDPAVARRKLLVYPGVDYYYLIDKERYNDAENFKRFLKKLKPTPEEKDITFKLGYSNISFELWILLHKQTFSAQCISQKDYLPYINRTFSTDFETLDEYKKENNFNKKILSQLTFDDVKRAIKAAKQLQKFNNENCDEKQYAGYRYFDANPSLSVHLVIEQILNEIE